MRFSDYERYQNLTAEDQETNWQALDDLLPHLNDHLLLVDEFEFYQISPCRLIAFTAKDVDKTQLYAIASDGGRVIVGKTKQLNETVCLDMADFDPQQCEVVSLTISGQDYFLGEYLSLWACVKRYADDKTETLLYHAKVGVDNCGHLQLTPALDDALQQQRNQWLAHVVNAQAPQFLKTWNFTAGYSLDPFTIPESVNRYLDKELPAINTVNWFNNKLCFSLDKEVYVVDTSKYSNKLTLNTLTEQASCLALTEDTTNQKTQGIVGCKDYWIVFFEENESDELIESWRQLQQDYPVAISFIGDSTNELLIIFSDGYLRKFHNVSPQNIMSVWRQCWQHLDLGELLPVEAFLTASKNLLTELKERESAYRYEMLRRLFVSASDASKEQRQQWLQLIADEQLFSLIGSQDGLPEPCIKLLLDALTTFATDQRSAWPLIEGGDLVPALIEQLYAKQLVLDDRQLIYQQLLTLNWSASAETDPAVQQLKRRAAVSIKTVWQHSPNPQSVEELLRYGDIALEFWANKFLSSDTVLFKQPLDKQGLVGILGITYQQTPYLLALKPHTIELYSLQPEVDRQKPLAVYDLESGQDSFKQIIAVQDNESGFLLLTDLGRVTVMQLLDPALANPLHKITQINCIEQHRLDKCYSWKMVTCPTSEPGVGLIAIAASLGRQAQLLLYRIHDHNVKFLTSLHLDIPWLSSLDLSLTGDGYLLFVASDQSPLAKLYHFDDNYNLKQERCFNILRNGVSCAVFDKKINPDYLLAGGYSGMLLCTALQAPLNLCWSYQLEGFISDITPITINDASHFLVASGAGELCLLSADQGKECWKERLNIAIYHLSRIAAEQNLIALALYRGQIKLFEQVSVADQQLAKAKVSDCLKQLKLLDNHIPGQFSSACINALHQIVNQGTAAQDVMINTQGKKVRGRILLYLINNNLINSNKAIISQLNFRELALSFGYTEKLNPQWRAAVWAELKTRIINQDVNISIATKAAFVTCLQHLSHEPQTTLDELSRHNLPSIYLEKSIWIRVEYARLLATMALKENNPQQNLIAKLLPYLLKLSPRLIYRLQVLFSQDNENYIDFKMLDSLCRMQTLTEDERLKALERLIIRLKPYPPSDKFTDLFLGLVSLHYCFLENTGESWRDWRKEALADLQELAKKLHAHSEITHSFLSLTILSRSLTRETLPSDTETIQQRLEAIEKVKQSFDITQASKVIRFDNGWQEYDLKLLGQTQRIIDKMLEKERKHILHLVRPRLTLVSQQLIGHKINLVLNASPEGNRQLHDVTIEFNAKGRYGLMPPGMLSVRLNYDSYSAQSNSELITLEGFVLPEQQEIQVAVYLQDETGYKTQTTWSFSLIKSLKTEYQLLSLPVLLPDVYEAFKKQVFTKTAPVMLVVCDQQLGYEQLLSDWDSVYPQQRLDLDQTSRKIGEGRKYSAAKLDYAFIDQQLKAAQTGRSKLMVAPVDELIQRLLADDNASVLKTWWYQLERHSTVPLILVVSSVSACALRRLGLNQICEIFAHQWVIAEHHSTDKNYTQQLIELVMTKADSVKDKAKHVCNQLGFDLRFILLWLQAIKLANQLIRVEDFINQPMMRQLITAELQALAPMNLIALLVGAEATMQLKCQDVQPGQFAADSYFSAPRKHARKLLQKLGEPFTDKSLEKLQNMEYPPDYVNIQGFGQLGTVTKETPLFKLCQLVNEPANLQALAERGLGLWVGGIFRTGSPYRNFIKQLYDAESGDINQRDNNVYASLLGEQHLPIEVIPSDKLLKFNNSELMELMPHAKSSDIKLLRHLALLWQAEEIDANLLLSSLRSTLIHDRFKLLSSLIDTKRWDFALLALKSVGIGINKAVNPCDEFYPETYLFWLDNKHASNIDDFKNAIAISTKKRNQWLDENSLENYTPRIIITGPASQPLEVDDERRYALIHYSDACSAVWQGDLLNGLVRKAKVQLHLTAFSPFKTSGALPPGSKVFRGRDEELNFLKARCRFSSILIIGSRRVGKTSLLNQFYDWALRESDVVAIKIDLQAIETRKDFLEQLRNVDDPLLDQFTLTSLKNLPDNAHLALSTLAKQLHQQGKKVLFLLNEIDGLVKHDAAFIDLWRSLNEDDLARFIMTGYTVIGQLGLPAAAYFHFTEGTHYGGKAISLTALSETSARAILDLLETSELRLKWRSIEEKAQAYALLLKRSYCIPWALQSYGRLLVEQLQEQRRDLITLPEVEKLLQHKGDVVWRYIEDIRYEDFDLNTHHKSQRAGILVLLYALARHRYFSGGQHAAIKDKNLDKINALDFGFTEADIYVAVTSIFDALPVFAEEKNVWRQWFNKLDLFKTLRLLTLTLILEPDPFTTNRYAFLLHIFPLELHRKYGNKDPMLNDLLMETLSEFLRLTKL